MQKYTLVIYTLGIEIGKISVLFRVLLQLIMYKKVPKQ